MWYWCSHTTKSSFTVTELFIIIRVGLIIRLPVIDAEAQVAGHLSAPYVWEQACSTSAMVFGTSEDRIRGPPLSRITTSSSILMPRPRKRSGTWSLSSQIYNPGSIVMAIPGCRCCERDSSGVSWTSMPR